MHWWNSLSNRERRTVSVGGIVIIGLLSYVFVWSPISTATYRLHHQIFSQKNLYRWMWRANQHIQALTSAGISKNSADISKVHDQTKVTLGSVERTLTNQGISLYVQHVQQQHTGQLVLNFHAVPFDKLMTWLQILVQQYDVSVEQFKASKTRLVGTVDANLMLRSRRR